MNTWDEVLERIRNQEKKMGPPGKVAIEFVCNECGHNWIGIFQPNERVGERPNRPRGNVFTILVHRIVVGKQEDIATYSCPACISRSIKILQRSRIEGVI